MKSRVKWDINLVRKTTLDLSNGDIRCVSDEYKKSCYKLRFICRKHGEFEMRWYSFYQGQRCPKCGDENRGKHKRNSIEYVSKLIDEYSNGLCKCLSTTYKNNSQKLKIECKKHGVFYRSWHSIVHLKTVCPICVKEECAKKRKLTYGTVKNIFESCGYRLLSRTYEGIRHKLEIECPVGHRYRISLVNFRRGTRCKECAYNKRRLTIDYIKSKTLDVTDNKYVCLSDKYHNNTTKLKFRCPRGHIFLMNWASFYSSGQRCPKCYLERRKINYNLDDYISYKRKVEIITRCNYRKYKWLINPFNLRHGQYEYQIDHIYSVADGFDNNVPPEILASPVNLRMLWWRTNNIKDRKSDMSKKMLNDLYNQFISEIHT